MVLNLTVAFGLPIETFLLNKLASRVVSKTILIAFVLWPVPNVLETNNHFLNLYNPQSNIWAGCGTNISFHQSLPSRESSLQRIKVHLQGKWLINVLHGMGGDKVFINMHLPLIKARSIFTTCKRQQYEMTLFRLLQGRPKHLLSSMIKWKIGMLKFWALNSSRYFKNNKSSFHLDKVLSSNGHWHLQLQVSSHYAKSLHVRPPMC